MSRLKRFPASAISQMGYEIHRLQCGEKPTSFKMVQQVGTGIHEIRVAAANSWFRVFYVASFHEAVYILHVFEKKRNSTSKKDLDIARTAFKKLLESRKQRKRNG